MLWILKNCSFYVFNLFVPYCQVIGLGLLCYSSAVSVNVMTTETAPISWVCLSNCSAVSREAAYLCTDPYILLLFDPVP